MPPQAHLIPAVAVDDTGNVHGFTGTTQSIENSHIVHNTRNTCNGSLIDFVLYLFVNKEHKLVDSQELELVQIQDATRETAKQRVVKKFIRTKCLRQLQLMNRAENNSPIHLDLPR